MWVFCKNDGVKQKKQVLSVKQTESCARADVIALSLQKDSSYELTNEVRLVIQDCKY